MLITVLGGERIQGLPFQTLTSHTRQLSQSVQAVQLVTTLTAVKLLNYGRNPEQHQTGEVNGPAPYTTLLMRGWSLKVERDKKCSPLP